MDEYLTVGKWTVGEEDLRKFDRSVWFLKQSQKFSSDLKHNNWDLMFQLLWKFLSFKMRLSTHWAQNSNFMKLSDFRKILKI